MLLTRKKKKKKEKRKETNCLTQFLKSYSVLKNAPTPPIARYTRLRDFVRFVTKHDYPDHIGRI